MDGETASSSHEVEGGNHHDEVQAQGGENEVPGGGAPANNQNQELLQSMRDMIQSAMFQIEELIDEKLEARVVEDTPVREQKAKEKQDGGAKGTQEKPVTVSFKTFKTCGATEFSGAKDPVAAYGWIDNIEKVFEISHCAVTDKVIYAAAMFTGEALVWWNSKRQTLGAEKILEMTWKTFTELFLQQYCPADLQRNYAREFLDLKQGEKTVGAYEAEFLRLSKFASQYLTNEKERIDRFIEGLRHEIREFVELKNIASFEKATEYARRRENAMLRRDTEVMPPPKRQFREGFSGSSTAFSRPSRQPVPARSHQPSQFHSRSLSTSQA